MTFDTEALRRLAQRSNDGCLCGPALQAADELDRLRATLSPPADPSAEARAPIDEDRRDSIIAGMCMTWDHSFGLMGDDEQNALWRQMAQLFEHDVLPAMLAFAAAERAKEVDEQRIFIPGRWRCAKCNFSLSTMSLNMGDGTVTMKDVPGEKCPNDGSPMWRVSYREAYEEMCNEANSEMYASMAIINRLRADEGASVIILCEAHDRGLEHQGIAVNDDWTNYQDRYFYGQTLFDALSKAEDAKASAIRARGA